MEKIERLNQEKVDMDTKLNQKKKEIKDNMNIFTKQSQILEKEKTLLNEKLVQAELKKKEIIESYEKEIQSLNSTVSNMKKEHLSALSQNQKEIETLRLKITGLERDINEKKASFEKEKLLLESKLKFIENQKEQYRKDLSDNQRKFETNLENLQKRTILEKEKSDLSSKNSISAVELKYQTQIKEINESHSKIYNDLSNQIKSLENDLSNAIALSDSKDKWKEEISALNKKIVEINFLNETLNKELEIQRKDKESKVGEISGFLEKERDGFKQKIAELERKISESESKKGKLIIDFEKEKSKLFSEKEHLETKIRELMDACERSEKKTESLSREIEKLKNQKNNGLLQSYYSNNNFANNSQNNDNLANSITNMNMSGKKFANFSKTGVNNFPSAQTNVKEPELYNTVNFKQKSAQANSPSLIKKERSNYTRSPANVSFDDNDLDLASSKTEIRKSPAKAPNYRVVDYDDEEPQKHD